MKDRRQSIISLPRIEKEEEEEKATSWDTQPIRARIESRRPSVICVEEHLPNRYLDEPTRTPIPPVKVETPTLEARRSHILHSKLFDLPRAPYKPSTSHSKRMKKKTNAFIDGSSDDEANHLEKSNNNTTSDEEDSSSSSSSESTEETPFSHYRESHPEWNRKFQKAVRAVHSVFHGEIGSSKLKQEPTKHSNEDFYSHRRDTILKRFSKLADLYCNFIDTATWYGKIIISERYLPVEHKTIKPAPDLGGIAGGEKYIVHNIIFKFCTDHVGLFGSDHNAQKLASHELKGLIHMFNHGSVLGLCVPMMTVLDYKGFRLIAMSRLPVRGDVTMVYGSRDAGKTILKEELFSEKLKLVCQELGLKPHKVRPAPNYSMRSSSSDSQWNPSGSTDSILGRSSETATPAVPDNEVLMYTPVDLEGHRGLDGNLYLLDFSRIFPPEYPDKNVHCSHLFRLFRPEFVKLYAKIKGPLSPDAFSKFSRGTDTSKEDNADIEVATKYLLEVQLPKCLKQLKSFVSIDPFAFIEAFHRNGINFRHFGNARMLIMKELDSPNKTKWANLLLIEMLARTAKNEIGHLMRCQVDHAKVPGDQKLKQIVANYLNIFFADSTQSKLYWNRKLKERLLEYFPNALTSEEVAAADFGTSIKGSNDISLLFRRVTFLSGIRMTSESLVRFQKQEEFAFESPIDETDIEAIVERVKNMSLAAYAKGYTFQMKAIHARDEKEARKFYQMAISKFKMALAMEPDHIDSLLQIFDAVVFLGYDNVAQSLYNTLISIAPHSYLLLYKYATFCQKIKDLEVAETNYLDSLEQNPNYLPCLVSYAKYLADMKKELALADKFFQRAMKIGSGSCFVLFNYACFLYQHVGDKAKAHEYWLRAIEFPTFESLDEILLLKDFGTILQDTIQDTKLATLYLDRFHHLKEEWELTHDTTVEYPKYKSRKCGDITSADYGYTM